MPQNPQQTDAILERLTELHPKLIDLRLERIERLLAALGNPERHLPPVVHVAGTNGKGSTISFMRAIAEAAGLTVHTYTSPHLVRFHERIKLNGKTIEEHRLLQILEECEVANEGAPITFFEITTAAAFVAYARNPADLLLLETGLGGRFDSTNVLEAPAVTVITPISLDHTEYLGETVEKIAFEKAGILKPGVPAIIGPQQPAALAVIERRSKEIDVPLTISGIDWLARPERADGMVYRDDQGEMVLPVPGLLGVHQIDNAGTAIAALRNRNWLGFSFEDFAAGISMAHWPGRLQRLENSPLAKLTPPGWEIWLDGGHNPAAGEVLATTFAGWTKKPCVLVCAMQENKDAAGFLAPLAQTADRLIAIDLPGDTPDIGSAVLADTACAFGIDAEIVSTLDNALGRLSGAPGRVLICGSLYLAGHVLARHPA
ncbi:MAG: bifunctional folylpolyglutamate synthase/dihydrofolate synthase [Rhodospirillaceae bacterium]|nr:bifunctional folylpolyglutamate synthase/dihydrofolate synthase [Rhodospirillaceae bacterium]